MRFVLFIVILTAGQPPAVETVGFSTERRCQQEAAAIEADFAAADVRAILRCFDTGSAVGPLPR